MRKKFFALAALALMLPSLTAIAGIGNKFGVVGLGDYSHVRYQGYKPTSVLTGGAGVAYKLNLGSGFALQPELLYNVKSAGLGYYMAGTRIDYLQNTIGYVELPFMISWGQDFNWYRSFFFVQPYVGYGVTCETEYLGTSSKILRANKWEEQNLSRFEYGIGVGVGFEFLRYQLRLQYANGLGGMCAQASKSTDLIHQMNGYSLKNSSFSSLQVVLGIFF